MKKKPASKSAFFTPRVLISFAFCAIGLLLALLAFALYPGGNALAKAPAVSAPFVQTSVHVTSSAQVAAPAKGQTQYRTALNPPLPHTPAVVLYDQINS